MTHLVDTLNMNTLHDQTNFKFYDHYGLLTLDGLGAAAICILIMMLLVFFFYKKEKALDFCGKYLTHAFFVVWILGFVVYDIGMYPEHNANGWSAFWAMIGVAPMAIIHAFEMFVLQSDVSAIHEECHNSSWYMFFFSLAHFLAAFISMVFVIKHFGFNIVASIIRYWKTHFSMSDIQDLYVFWGMNDATFYLAKDIIKGNHLANSKIVIIRINGEKEGVNERLGMERLFSFLSLSKTHLERLQELQKMGCLSANTFGSLTNLSFSEGSDIIRYELSLNSLVRLIHRTKGTLQMFFLDENDANNIKAVANLKKDKGIITFAQKGFIKFYCHARYNSIHRVIEDELVSENVEVKVIDSSHICVELMKKNPDLHPVNYVKVEKDARVSSPFNALVIGFGEVGLDTVRFLYEFGAFVKYNGVEGIIERSEFHCHVVDEYMADLAGLFYANAPSISITMDRKEDENDKQINLYNMDCRSIDFYERLKVWIETLNYVVVATGDDETNISLAVRILRLAIRNRKDDLSELRILVRIQHDDNGHIQKIADHYNRIWAAEQNRQDEKSMHQRVISSTDLKKAPITLFGSANEVYTYEHVVNDTLRNDAKKFKKKYDLSVNVLKQLAGEETYPIQSWDEEQNALMQLSGDFKGFAPTFSGVMKLRRVQSQNIANSLHKETKKILAKKALGEDNFNAITTHGLTRNEGCKTYSWRDCSNLPLENIQRVLDVLAQTEHLRWNASHEILGYIHEGEEDFKDEARFKHGCLKPWHKLSEKMQSNDYNVVDVSLGLIDINDNEY